MSRIENRLAVKVTIDNPSNNRRRIRYLRLDKGERADTDTHNIEPSVEKSKVARNRGAEDDAGKVKLTDDIVYCIHGTERATVAPGSQTTSIILNSMKNLSIIIDNDIKTIKGRGRVLNNNNTSSEAATNLGRNEGPEGLILVGHQRLIRTIRSRNIVGQITNPSAIRIRGQGPTASIPERRHRTGRGSDGPISYREVGSVQDSLGSSNTTVKTHLVRTNKACLCVSPRGGRVQGVVTH
jgi:hypothetical protein